MAIALEVRGDGFARLQHEGREAALDEVGGGGEADGAAADHGDGQGGHVVLHRATFRLGGQQAASVPRSATQQLVLRKAITAFMCE